MSPFPITTINSLQALTNFEISGGLSSLNNRELCGQNAEKSSVRLAKEFG